MRVGLAQINSIVGDVTGNKDLIISQIKQAESKEVDLIVFPEQALIGYPLRDLILRQSLIEKNLIAIEEIASVSCEVPVLVGFIHPDKNEKGKGIYNAAALCRNGKIEQVYAKQLLPTYDVFDEARYFNRGKEDCIFELATNSGNYKVGISICEDLFNNDQYDGREVYGVDPIANLASCNVDLIVNLSASPFESGKIQLREKLFSSQAKEHKLNIAYVNQVGGNDDIIFDGISMGIDSSGRIIARSTPFQKDFLIVDFNNNAQNRLESCPDDMECIRKALVLGIHDYVSKCGFKEVLIGVSGGIDSALVAGLAVEALGAKRVHTFAMPSRYSSDHSIYDAKILAENLGVDFHIIPIEPAHKSMENMLKEYFGDTELGVAGENMQARIRGQILMAISNQKGWLLLTTGNKSELAVGYCTLYGDMCGGLAVISDVPKTMVYELCRHINSTAGREIIPENTINKPPSAELKPDQTDQDTLPSYDVLDAILELFVKQEKSSDEIIQSGYEREIVEKVTRWVDRNEYKRQQMPIGLRVTTRAFGSGRRIPVAARYV